MRPAMASWFVGLGACAIANASARASGILCGRSICGPFRYNANAIDGCRPDGDNNPAQPQPPRSAYVMDEHDLIGRVAAGRVHCAGCSQDSGDSGQQLESILAVDPIDSAQRFRPPRTSVFDETFDGKRQQLERLPRFQQLAKNNLNDGQPGVADAAPKNAETCFDEFAEPYQC